jgi:molybdopterin adenylyltransferase
VNLPGNPEGAVESLSFILQLIPHALDLLQGRTEH